MSKAGNSILAGAGAGSVTGIDCKWPHELSDRTLEMFQN